MQVSIIIVSYNTCRLLCDCLNSIYQQTKELDFEVIVVDNASKDDTCQVLELSYPQVRLIRSAENLGFGRANNLGVQYASGKYLLFLNSDTLFRNNAAKYFCNYMEAHEHEDIGAIGSWLLTKEGKVNHSYGIFPTPGRELKSYISAIGQKLSRRSRSENDILGIPLKWVDFVIGADLFMKKIVFEQIGMFDSAFFMYYEDTDLQYQMRKIGLKRGIITGPEIIHLEGVSSGGTKTGFVFKQSKISLAIYLKKNYSSLKLFYYKLTLYTSLYLKMILSDSYSFQTKFRLCFPLFNK